MTFSPATTILGSIVTTSKNGTPLILMFTVTLEDQNPMSLIALNVIKCSPRDNCEVVKKDCSDRIPSKFEIH